MKTLKVLDGSEVFKVAEMNAEWEEILITVFKIIEIRRKIIESNTFIF